MNAAILRLVLGIGSVALLAGGLYSAQADPLELPAAAAVDRTYDISDLLRSPASIDYYELERQRAGAQGPATQAMRPATSPLAADVVRSIQQASRDWPDSIALDVVDGQLHVRTTESNHQRLVDLLQLLRERRNTQVQVEVRFLTLDAVLAARLRDLLNLPVQLSGQTQFAPASDQYRLLDDRQVRELLAWVQASPECTVLAAPRLTLFNGQQGCVTLGTETPYIADYTPTANPTTGQTTLQPQTASVTAGIVLQAQAQVSPDRKVITLQVHPRLTRLLEIQPVPFPNCPPDQKLIVQVPLLSQTEVSTTVSIPNHRTIVLGTTGPSLEDAAQGRGEVSLVLARASVLPPTTRPAR